VKIQLYFRGEPVDSKGLLIGRDLGQGAVAPSGWTQQGKSSVSTKHCLIKVEESRLLVIDMASRNGTWVGRMVKAVEMPSAPTDDTWGELAKNPPDLVQIGEDPLVDDEWLVLLAVDSGEHQTKVVWVRILRVNVQAEIDFVAQVKEPRFFLLLSDPNQLVYDPRRWCVEIFPERKGSEIRVNIEVTYCTLH
jgi:pSer/pThr/pTyr-binding forkhead associated (FHA) protein